MKKAWHNTRFEARGGHLKKIWEWWKYWRTWPFKYISYALYWLRAHTLDRYHMLDIRDKRNGYAWGWMDRSEGILFANMAILVSFIEDEKAFDCHVDWRSAAEMEGKRAALMVPRTATPTPRPRRRCLRSIGGGPTIARSRMTDTMRSSTRHMQGLSSSRGWWMACTG